MFLVFDYNGCRYIKGKAYTPSGQRLLKNKTPDWQGFNKKHNSTCKNFVETIPRCADAIRTRVIYCRVFSCQFLKYPLLLIY